MPRPNPYAALEDAFLARVAGLKSANDESQDMGPADVWLASRMAATSGGCSAPPPSTGTSKIEDDLIKAIVMAQIENNQALSRRRGERELDREFPQEITPFQRAQLDAEREDRAALREGRDLDNQLKRYEIRNRMNPFAALSEQQKEKEAAETGIGLPDSPFTRERQTHYILDPDGATKRYAARAQMMIGSMGPGFDASKLPLDRLFAQIDADLPFADAAARTALKQSLQQRIVGQLHENAQPGAIGNAPTHSTMQLYRLQRDPWSPSSAVPVDPNNSNASRQGSAGLVWASPEEADRFTRNDAMDRPDPLVDLATREPAQGPTIDLGFWGGPVISGGRAGSFGKPAASMTERVPDEALNAKQRRERAAALSNGLPDPYPAYPDPYPNQKRK